MAQLLKVRLIEGNDDSIILAATRGGLPIPLGDEDELELYLKTTEHQSDSDAILLTRGGGQIVTVNAGVGLAEAIIDGSHIVPELTFWRYDLVESGARRTLLYGPLEVVNV